LQGQEWHKESLRVKDLKGHTILIERPQIAEDLADLGSISLMLLMMGGINRSKVEGDGTWEEGEKRIYEVGHLA
jgi:hypothetical protein